MTSDTLARLEKLKAQPKFVDEPGTIYNGMRPEHERLTAQHLVNNLIEEFIADDDTNVKSKRLARRRFTSTLKRFNGTDTEDRERMCRYVEEIADILEIEKPRILITYWLYGPVLGTLLLLTRRKTN